MALVQMGRALLEEQRPDFPLFARRFYFEQNLIDQIDDVSCISDKLLTLDEHLAAAEGIIFGAKIELFG